MLKGFYGTYTPRMDDKGRVTLPARYREAFASGAMMVRGQDHCLYVFTPEGFEEFAESAINAPITDERARGYQRYMLANTDEQRPDAQGRITITARMREYAGSVQGPGHHRHRPADGDLGRRRVGGLRGAPGGGLRGAGTGAAGAPDPRERGSCRPARTRIGPDTTSPVPGPSALTRLPPCQDRRGWGPGIRNHVGLDQPGPAAASISTPDRPARSAQHSQEGARRCGAARPMVTMPKTGPSRHRVDVPRRRPIRHALRTATSRCWSAGSTNCSRRPSRRRPDPGARDVVLVDATLGMGGHTLALLTAHPGLRVIGIDRDPQALRIAERAARPRPA